MTLFDTPRNKAFLALAGTAIAALAFGTASYAGPSTTNTINTPYCEILATPSGNGVALQGVFHADAKLQGSYKLAVSGTGGGNRSTINQGGQFAAPGAGTVPLGQVNVGGSAIYAIDLTVTAGGTTHTCGGTYSA